MRELLGLFLGPPRASKCVHGLYLHAADRGIGLIGEILEHVVEHAQLELLHAGDDGSDDRLGREPELRPEADLGSDRANVEEDRRQVVGVGTGRALRQQDAPAARRRGARRR